MQNIIDYSVLKQYYSTAPYRGFGIKYVASGTELYMANGNRYYVTGGEYLLTNSHCQGFVKIDSNQPVEGICIDINPAIVAEAAAGHMRPDTDWLDLELDTFFSTNRFLENKYNVANTNVGRMLTGITNLLQSSPTTLLVQNDFYYTIAEHIIADHIPLVKQLQQIKTVKHDTRKHLMRKLIAGKELLDNYFTNTINIAQVATHCGLSEYHFFRLFKAAFGVSPHQYLINRRLQHAHNRISRQQLPVSAVAIESGFADIYAFSKSFKKHYGYSPSTLLHKTNTVTSN